jgi:GT2 family glycosyltransferase
LRFSERVPATHIAHIPKVLYHWRMTEGSTALSGVDAKPYALSSSRRAIEDAIDRRKLSAKRVDGILPFSHRVTYEIQGEPLVSIIIPFRDQPEFLKRCVFSVLEKSSYKNIEILLVDNDSRERATQEVLKSFTPHKNIRILRYEKPFNYSAINNFAASAAQGQYVCLLNNDVEVITPEWLSTLLEYAQLPEIGAVGAKLLYPNGKVQHGGIILGLGGYCAHSHRFSNHDDYGFMGRLVNIGNIMAVTGACLLVSKDKFFEVGGLDETKFPIAYNDVDLCLKLHTAGYRNIFNPYAKLYHYESVSRGEDTVDIEKSIRFSFEKENLKQKWKEYIARDPYYNPHLTLDAEDFSLKEIAFGPDVCSVATVRKALSQM